MSLTSQDQLQKDLPKTSWILVFLMFIGFIVCTVTAYYYAIPHIRAYTAVVIPSGKALDAAVLPDLFEDTSLSIQQIIELDRNQLFQRLDETDLPVLNNTPNQTRWFRFTIQNPTNDIQHSILDLIWRIYDIAILYQLDSGGTLHIQKTGAMIAPDDPHLSKRWKAFNIILPPQSSNTYYLKVQDYYRLPNEFKFWVNVDEFINWELTNHVQTYSFLFVWLAITSISFFRYAILRESAMLSFIAYAIVSGLSTLNARLTINPFHQFPNIPTAEFITGILFCVAQSLLILYFRRFTDSAKFYLKHDRYLKFLQYIWLFFPFILLITLDPRYGLACLTLGAILAAITNFSLLIIAFLIWRGGSKLGLLFILALLPITIGIIFYAFNAYELDSQDDEQRFIAQLGRSISLVILSFCPIYRSRNILEQNYQLQLSYASSLEKDVEERTVALRRLSDRLLQALKNRDNILAIIGHDLRGPAVSMQALAQLISIDDSITPEEFSQWAKKMGQASSHHLELLNNLMMFGGVHGGHMALNPKQLNLHECAAIAIKQMRNLSEPKNITIHNHITPNSVAYSDEVLLQTVLRNVLTNAIKFSFDNGEIVIKTVALSAQHIEVQVIDYGTGLDEQQLNNLFRGVATSLPGTHGEKGSGLGLNLCRDLLHSVNGDIAIQSQRTEQGATTTVSIKLPVRKPKVIRLDSNEPKLESKSN